MTSEPNRREASYTPEVEEALNNAAYEKFWREQAEAGRKVAPRRERSVTATLQTFIVAVLFGIVIPLLGKVFLNSFADILNPPEALPVLGIDPMPEATVGENGTIEQPATPNLGDTFSGYIDSLMLSVASYLSAFWLVGFIYVFPIVFQLRIAVIYGKLVDTFCLALTLLGPALVLLILPLWGSILL